MKLKQKNKKKIKVAIFFGGYGEEYKVSIKSAKSVVGNIDQNIIEIIPIFLSRDRKWFVKKDAWQKLENKKINIKNEINIFDFFKKEKIDLALPLIHGEFGEDGKLQSILEFAKIPYLFSGIQTSSLTINKEKTKNFLNNFKILSPKFILFKQDTSLNDFQKLKFPLIFKPVDGGSSVDIFLVKNKKELNNSFFKKTKKKNRNFLVEEFIQGREFSVSIMGNKKAEVLAITEIIPQLGEFYDYNSKYKKNDSLHICPAEIDKKLENKMKKISLKIYQILGIKDLGRIDFMVDKNNNIFFIEANTVPGMTETSLVPEAAKNFGFSFQNFLTKLILEKIVLNQYPEHENNLIIENIDEFLVYYKKNKKYPQVILISE